MTRTRLLAVICCRCLAVSHGHWSVSRHRPLSHWDRCFHRRETVVVRPLHQTLQSLQSCHRFCLCDGGFLVWVSGNRLDLRDWVKRSSHSLFSFAMIKLSDSCGEPSEGRNCYLSRNGCLLQEELRICLLLCLTCLRSLYLHCWVDWIDDSTVGRSSRCHKSSQSSVKQSSRIHDEAVSLEGNSDGKLWHEHLKQIAQPQWHSQSKTASARCTHLISRQFNRRHFANQFHLHHLSEQGHCGTGQQWIVDYSAYCGGGLLILRGSAYCLWLGVLLMLGSAAFGI